MSNINITAGEFICSDPASPWALAVNMGTTYRGSNNQYYLNYSWNSAMYDNIGLATDVVLRYILDGGTSQPYNGTLPDNATNFQIQLPAHDSVILQFEFQVAGGTQCYLNINVSTPQIQFLP